VQDREGERDICATRLIHMRDIPLYPDIFTTWLSILHNTDSIWRERLIGKGDIPVYLAQHWPLLSILHNTDSMRRERRMRCMTRSYTWHPSLSYTREGERDMYYMTHWYNKIEWVLCKIERERETSVQHDSFICVTSLSILHHRGRERDISAKRLIHICDIPLYPATWLIDIGDIPLYLAQHWPLLSD